jgi:hypothetical protein
VFAARDSASQEADSTGLFVSLLVFVSVCLLAGIADKQQAAGQILRVH